MNRNSIVSRGMIACPRKLPNPTDIAPRYGPTRIPTIGLNRNAQLSQTPEVKPNEGMMSKTVVIAAKIATKATFLLVFEPIGSAIVPRHFTGCDLNLFVILLSKYHQVVSYGLDDKEF
jgi:hypothetical protein